VLTTIEKQLIKLGIPNAYGWSIIALTLLVKLVTTPLTKKQVESSLAMQELKPKIQAIKDRYGGDKDRVQKETSFLYEEAGVDPLAGCGPTLFTIPIFWGLFRSLSTVSASGYLDSASFFWIPTLAGPTTMADRAAGSGTSWLFPFVDGAPPIGWHDAILYLVLPVSIVVLQYASQTILTPPYDEEDESQSFTKNLIKVLPLMIGWFSLNVPAGLGLYYFSNTALTMAQQIYLRKLGGATTDVDASKISSVGTAVRSENSDSMMDDEFTPDVSMDLTEARALADAEGLGSATTATAVSVPMPDTRCKRSRIDPLNPQGGAESSVLVTSSSEKSI